MNKICQLGLVWVSFLIAFSLCQSRNVEIIEPRQRVEPDGVKVDKEAELSFFTESLGFVNDKFMQISTAWRTFLKNFSKKYVKGSETFDTRITNEYLNENESHLCSVYFGALSFTDSEIVPFWINNRRSIGYVRTRLKFQYFSVPEEIVKVIQCPVLVDQQLSYLYFQEVYTKWIPIKRKVRAMFVFASDVNIHSHSERHVLELLMFTTNNSKLLPVMDTTGDEAKVRNYSRQPATRAFQIKFPIRSLGSSANDKLRLFGEHAELFFLTKTYGFLNYNFHAYWKIKELILILERMKKDYKIDTKKMKTERNSTQENELCAKYIKNNDQLLQREILLKQQHRSNIANWVTKYVQFPLTHMLLDGREREILQCSVTFTKNREPGYIYLLPIHYKRKKLSQVIIFKDDMGMKADQVYPFLMSAFHTTFETDIINISDAVYRQDQTEINYTNPKIQTYAESGGRQYSAARNYSFFYF